MHYNLLHVEYYNTWMFPPFQACKESCLAYNQLEKCGCMEYRFPGSSKHGICNVIDKPTSKCLRPSCFLKPIFLIPSNYTIYRQYCMAEGGFVSFSLLFSRGWNYEITRNLKQVHIFDPSCNFLFFLNLLDRQVDCLYKQQWERELRN